MTVSRRSSAVFSPESAAVHDARELVRTALGGWPVPSDRGEDAVLLVSELVTNAIVHAGTEIELVCALDEDRRRVRVEVRDLMPSRRLGDPVVGRPAEDGYRGLMLTHWISDAWGVSYTRTDKTVWFELGLTAGGSSPEEPMTLPEARAADPAEPVPDEQLIDHVVQWLRATTDADAAYVLLSAADGGLRVRATAPAGGVPDTGPDSPRAAAELLAMAEEACRHAAAGPVRGGVLTVPPGGRLRSLGTVPVWAEGERLGLVAVAAEHAGRFGAPDVTRLRHAAASLGPVLARDRLPRADHGYRNWLGFLTEASDLLAGTLDEKLVPALGAQLFVPRIAGWCAFYLEDSHGAGELAHVWHADEQRIAALRQALAAASPPVPDRARTPRPWNGPGLLGPAARQACGPLVMEFPLVNREHRFGAVLLGEPVDGEFRSELVRLAEDLCERVTRTLLTARRYGEQAATSRILQRSLLPAQLPAIPGLDYHIVYEPAGEGAEAGGDFYDLFPAGPGRWRFMLGDVCGTGAEAAAVAGLARHTLRALSREDLGVARALARLNDAMIDESAARLLTIVHGELEPGPAGVRMTVTSAGHPLPLWLRPGGEVIPIGAPQVLLGVVPTEYQLDSVLLTSGDVVLLVTDGITERRDGGRLLDDGDGLSRVLAGCAGLTARAVTLRVMSAVRDFGKGALTDDMAVIALRVE
ncbi:SpoIIE family protein phosphatase [Actinomadura namibiensis]|uniref:Serine phosphatase RsbU (Regulator of sigma subunit)/anti-sigma regulatory factor (Ser/Thr protein kinase) n=1 Tax=Actinomadura namibiensis TaxID=182080 RepID=A0A7W3LQB1_ACTNM|nr:ATP-binding SpoIIE family protein phosphatase [Actinomadura namibiensis]MBA8952309.1 serine phosphatase RsbU (regulator of sigma subunit)/anti-sigma regulatory factor (Ser/Thr protein kinase) [Actinomadura namibiensis]